ncbi:11541_t:CDS:2, partial [Acaulospora colombiana]
SARNDNIFAATFVSLWDEVIFGILNSMIEKTIDSILARYKAVISKHQQLKLSTEIIVFSFSQFWSRGFWTKPSISPPQTNEKQSTKDIIKCCHNLFLGGIV